MVDIIPQASLHCFQRSQQKAIIVHGMRECSNNVKCHIKFFDKIQDNPPGTERQALQNVTFYPTGTQPFLV